MNIKHKIETAKANLKHAAEQAHLNNPIRLKLEKRHNRKVFAAIEANGGRMTDEMWEGTFFGRVLSGQTCEDILIQELSKK